MAQAAPSTPVALGTASMAMVHVAPGSRSPFWSQNQVKVLIDRESSFHIRSTKTPSQIFFLNSTRFVHQASMLLRFQDLNPTPDA